MVKHGHNGNNGEQDHFLKKHAGRDEKLIIQQIVALYSIYYIHLILSYRVIFVLI